MMNKIKWILKKSNGAYVLYNYGVSSFLKMLGLFLKIDEKLVLINSYGGARYDDSPKVIYEYMKSNPKYDDFSIVWVLDQLPKDVPKDIKWVKNNSLEFFVLALKAKYWVTNSSMERGLKFKKKKTIYVNTWHGTALKKMGFDTGENTRKLRVSSPDIFYCQGQYDKETFVRAFRYPERCMRIVGLPRNDELAKVTKERIASIRRRMEISRGKKVILYAPTFRDYVTDTSGNCLTLSFNVEKWRSQLANDYVILFRAHYEVSKVLNIKYDDFIINATNYGDLNELMMISDVLISDYSSIMIDYSILGRPIFSYAYDLEEYSKMRGLYFDLNNILPNGVHKNEEDVIDAIINMNKKEQKERTLKFRNRFVEKFGNAAEYIDEIILQNAR